MPVVKMYRTYPIHRDQDGTFTVQVGEPIQGRAIPTLGQFDSMEEAKAFVDEQLEELDRKFRPSASK